MDVACERVTLTHPASNAHAPYCLRPLWFHQMFLHYLINGTIFWRGEGGAEHEMCVLIFPTTLI